nr:GTPase [Mycoplasmopsis bovis]
MLVKVPYFNRLVGKRSSITFDRPGVTRDRLYESFMWNGKEINVIDTGGIQIEKKDFQDQILIQAKIAIQEANVVIFIVDGQSSITSDDKMIYSMLQKSGKPIIVVSQ